MIEFYMKAAGVTFEGRQRVLSRLQIGDKLLFSADPDNIHDFSAVRIETEDGIQVGFVPRDKNATIFQNLITQQGAYQVEVSAVTGGGFDTNYGVNMLVRYYPAEENTRPTADIKMEPVEVDDVSSISLQFSEQICPTCGSLSESGSGKCSNCGYSFDEDVHAITSPEPTEPTESDVALECPECGGWIEAKILACPKCGFPRKLLHKRLDDRLQEASLVLKYYK